MVASGLTVPELLGASTNVSKLRDYVAIFDRVFEVMTPPEENACASKAIKARDVPGGTSAWNDLERIYEARHRLVHEISHEQIGHRNHRDPTRIEDAVRQGRLVQACMREVESIITTHAPADFPNLLQPDGNPVFEVGRLQGEIEAAEGRLNARAVTEPDMIHGAGLDISAIAPAVTASRLHIETELAWLREFRPAGWGYHNPADDLTANLLRARLAYLHEVEEVLRAS
jgi:hypothetical protein